MNLKKSLVFGVLIGGIVLGSIGCGKQEEKNFGYYITREHGDRTLKKDLKYKSEGKLNKIKIDNPKDNYGKADLVICTYKNDYEATYANGTLYYIGEKPNKENIIEGVYKREVKEIDLKDKEIKYDEESGKYTYLIKEGNKIRALSLKDTEGNPQLIDFVFKKDGVEFLKNDIPSDTTEQLSVVIEELVPTKIGGIGDI